MATGGRDDHVRWTRSLSRRALGGDRDPGWLHRFRPRGAHSRDAGARASACCWRAPPSSSPSASGPCISSACWPRRIPADTVYLVLPTIISFLICALVVGISLFFVSDRRAVAAARDLVGGAARGRDRQHALCRHARSGRQFRHRARRPHGAAVGAGRDRRGLWRLARVPGAAGRPAADRKFDRVRRSRCRACTTPPCTACISCRCRTDVHHHAERAGRVAANALGGRGRALLRDRGGLPAVAGAGSAAASRGGGRRGRPGRGSRSRRRAAVAVRTGRGRRRHSRG